MDLNQHSVAEQTDPMGVNVPYVLAAVVIVNLYVLISVTRQPLQDAPVWLFGQGKYYVVDSAWAKSAKVSLDKELPFSYEEVVSKVAQEVKSDGAVMERVEETLREKHGEEIRASLRKQINAELREQKSAAAFYNMEKSYKILDDLRADYLKHNGEKLKNLILRDFLRNTTDASLRERVEGLESLGVDRKRYFLHIVQDLLARNSPFGLGVDDTGEDLYGIGVGQVPDPVLSEEFLAEGRVRLSITDLLDLQDKHEAVVRALKELPTPPKEIYSGDGIVIAARRKDMVGALNVIVQARQEGSELPVEVVLNKKEDYNEHYCQEVLPALNGKCLVAETEIGTEAFEFLNPTESDGFPLKVLSLVVSSFDNTVLLDADSFPIKNVDTLLSSVPFLESRYILWPDMWHRTISPLYYKIAGIEHGEVVRRGGLSNEGSFLRYIKEKALFHDHSGLPSTKSVELGQLVVSKRERFRSLFLSLYYNLNGPRYYYPLLYQGSHGVGDRETLVPALEVMNEPYYLTEWSATFSGVERKKPHVDELYFDESTMVQSDPAEAKKYLVSWRKWLREKNMDVRLDPNQDGKFTQDLRYDFFTDHNKVRLPTAFFLHMHDPKINSLSNELLEKSRYDYSDRFLKSVGQNEYVMGATDWELRFQAINAWSTCVGFTDKLYWESFGVDRGNLCEKSRGYVETLKKSSNDASAAEIKVPK